jgi:hypothetical protein
MSDRVAIITPVRDGAATLPTLAGALTRQGVNLGSLSWVVADDGSSDDSAKVARCAARSRDLRLTLVNTNGAEGPGPARNLAVQAALADPDVKWLTFVDADDALEPGALAAWWARASARHADLLLTAPPRSIVGRMRANLGESARTLDAADLWDGETLRLWGVYGKFIHRDIAANAAFPAVMETEDLTYYLELFDHAQSVTWAPDLPRYVYPEAARSGVRRAPRLPLQTLANLEAALVHLGERAPSRRDLLRGAGPVIGTVAATMMRAVALESPDASFSQAPVRDAARRAFASVSLGGADMVRLHPRDRAVTMLGLVVASSPSAAAQALSRRWLAGRR